MHLSNTYSSLTDACIKMYCTSVVIVYNYTNSMYFVSDLEITSCFYVNVVSSCSPILTTYQLMRQQILQDTRTGSDSVLLRLFLVALLQQRNVSVGNSSNCFALEVFWKEPFYMHRSGRQKNVPFLNSLIY